MLSPTPFSLFCALLLCLPLAIIFTIITPPTPTTTSNTSATSTTNTTSATSTTNTTATTNGGATAAPTPNTTTTTTNKTSVNPLPTFTPTIKTQENIKNTTTTTSPPPAAAEDDDDEPLLRRASRVNPNPSTPKKVAFMFLTTTPLPFAPLWEIFFNQTPTNLYNIYIHAAPSSPYDPPFSGLFENRVIPDSKPTRRFSPTLVSAARRLLSHALLHDPSNSMFALLSPSCIPLHSFNFTYKILIQSKKSFIEILKNEGGAYQRWAARGEQTMLPELPFHDFRIGSQFFVLTRKHARIVVSDRRLWSKFKLPCLDEYACYPEEHYFPPLVNMEDPRGCVPATLTHVDWRNRHDGHPRTYTASEVGPDLILSLRTDRPRYGDDEINGSDSSVSRRHDPFLFARKFSPDSIQPLLRIANDVIFKD
ncbi:glycosyltransferase BC10-like [Camellia sinensis]|nr:glycosyltransferase BC10-like [Camellia sinensis]